MPIFNARTRALSCTLMLVVALGACSKPKPSPYHSGNYPGKLKIGTPYEIDGRTYYPAHNPAYDESGVASWYGPGFHGRSTANGERFDQNAMTAAHRTLPMPSVVRVTNLENGKTAILKVNDRGPFKKDRIIDLSKRAAEELDVIGKGTANVRVQYLPHETERLIADLMRDNQLVADEKTLAALSLNKPAPDVVLAKAATDVPKNRSLGLISSAQAAEPIGTANPSPSRAVEDIAPLRPVASRDLSNPTEIQGDIVPAIMPETDDKFVAGQRLSIHAGQITTMQTEQAAYVDAPSQDTAPPANVLREDAPAYRESTPKPAQPEADFEMASLTPEPVSTASVSNLYVQAGSFSQEGNAKDLVGKLSHVGQAGIQKVNVAGRTWYRVRVGPLDNNQSANQALQSVVNLGMPDARIIRD